MLQNLFRPFADWGIRLRNRANTDPFFKARIVLMLLYLAVGMIIFMFLGWFISGLRFGLFLENTGLNQPGSATELAYLTYQHELLLRRFILVAIFVVSTYFVTEFALRSIRRSVQLQQRFFETVSHELRTPLTIMKNTAEVTLRNPAALTEDKARNVIRSMQEETDRMSRTITFLLSLSSLSIQKQIPDRDMVSLAIIAEDCLHMLESEARVGEIAFVKEVTNEGLVHGNSTALQGLVTNLLINALKHTPPGGTIRLSLSLHKRRVHLIISDTGSGISSPELPYIFEPFFQGTHSTIRTSREGMGLGLSLVREVARLHGARISVESTEGKGTRFLLQFPSASLSPASIT